jgi:hypothetical protein
MRAWGEREGEARRGSANFITRFDIPGNPSAETRYVTRVEKSAAAFPASGLIGTFGKSHARYRRFESHIAAKTDPSIASKERKLEWSMIGRAPNYNGVSIRRMFWPIALVSCSLNSRNSRRTYRKSGIECSRDLASTDAAL